MERLLILAVAALALALPASAKSAAARAGVTDCALESQRAVARRHRLAAATDNSLSLKIYADPRLAQEADDAFDACIRRQPTL
jgi:hypothetical protein